MASNHRTGSSAAHAGERTHINDPSIPFDTENAPTLEETICNHLVPAAPYSRDKCSICWEHFDGAGGDHNAVICRTNHNCGHVFGRNCLEKWLNSKRATSNACPVCRAVLFNIDKESVVHDHLTLDGIVSEEQYLRELLGGILPSSSGANMRITADDWNQVSREMNLEFFALLQARGRRIPPEYAEHYERRGLPRALHFLPRPGERPGRNPLAERNTAYAIAQWDMQDAYHDRRSQ
jgi:hypothetical protein